ncbi:putative alpha-glucoside transport-related protein [Naematelia encephala]|uniref:Putative alpha-glucoside transport-related protein n=1 Tax=Naematelia encephala TaxID=71784 RepID=A0A1Y2AXR2_9TREE|nr:putative alpha-glucoside transport-related protein [Naematelia encephala]
MSMPIAAAVSTNLYTPLDAKTEARAIQRSDMGIIEERIDDKNVAWRRITEEADRDEVYQHNLTLWQSLKTHRAAVLWSVCASFCIIMEAYDTLLLGSLFALPAFKQHFGTYGGAKAGWQIPASWQAGMGQAANVGSIIGVILGAFLVDRWGYKRSVVGMLVLICPLIALVTFAPNKGALLAGELLCGIPWGVFSTLAEAYASEVCPLTLRAYLTTSVNLCWVIGHLIGAGILKKAQLMTGIWSFRMPFAVQWAWPVPLIVAFSLAPESPWWLVRKGHVDKAERSIRRLAPAAERDTAHDTVSAMIRTNELEKDVSSGTSFLDCFRGADLRRTEISVISWTCQIMCGLQFANYSTYFFEQAGLATSNAFTMTIVLYACAFVGTVLSWFLLTYVGRRKVFVVGLACLSVGQFLIGALSVVADHGHNGARWGQAALMVIWLFVYDMTVGPTAYVIVGETSSTRLRNKTVGLSRLSYNCFSICFGVMSPYMLNPTEWGWKGKIGFFWGPICFLCFIWAFFRLPEMKGRSYYELDIMFDRKIPARKFATYVVERNTDEQSRQVVDVETSEFEK